MVCVCGGRGVGGLEGNLLGVCKWTGDLCLWKNFVPRVLSAHAQGLYTCTMVLWLANSPFSKPPLIDFHA